MRRSHAPISRRSSSDVDDGAATAPRDALHRIAITKARRDPETIAYLTRKHAEGKTRREAIRCLKRHLARKI